LVVATERKEKRYDMESLIIVAGPSAARLRAVTLSRPTTAVSTSDIRGLTSHAASVGSAKRAKVAVVGAPIAAAVSVSPLLLGAEHIRRDDRVPRAAAWTSGMSKYAPLGGMAAACSSAC
jgi:hypothetical protein